MLSDFEKYRLEANIKPTTLKYELMVINQLIAYLNTLHKKSVEPYEIKPSEIHDFIDQQRKTNKISTVNRKIGHIKNWFDYLWRSKQITYDFMEKFEFIKDETKTNSIHVNYKMLLDKRKIIAAANIPITAKLLYIFYLKGLRPRDIFEITINDFKDKGSTFELNIETISGYDAHIVFDNPVDVGIILSAIERAVFRNIPYILSSKNSKGYYDKFNQDSNSNYIEHIVNLIGVQFSSGTIRQAYINHLYDVENKSVEEIAMCVGTSLSNIALALKKSVVSTEEQRYNII
ncbi:site-specific integrase [Viridibacillus arvi]|uniref:site-specific integrase n=1 Tax=Viridibacillus arvi TaxID=263475 RepID=UPI003D2A42F4